MLDWQSDEQGAVRHLAEVEKALHVDPAVLEEAQVAFEAPWCLGRTLRASHDVVRLAEGTDARAVKCDCADTLAAQIVPDVEAGCWVGGCRALERGDVQPPAGLARLVVLV